MSSYDNGVTDGQWTLEQVRQCGFRSSEECLRHQEQVYQTEIAALPGLRQKDPQYAAQHAEYLAELIAATRKSLGELIAKEGEE